MGAPIRFTECAALENMHAPPKKGLEFPGGWGFYKAQKFKETYKA